MKFKNVVSSSVPTNRFLKQSCRINFLFQGGGERRSGGYGDRRQRGNKKFRRKIVQEINLLAH